LQNEAQIKDENKNGRENCANKKKKRVMCDNIRMKIGRKL
jgi:hypothetical protein